MQNVPLWIALALGGVPLVWELLVKLWHREFGSDLLAGISIVTSVLLDEYLAGTLVVLMLSGGETLEAYAVRSASSVLEALAKRMPTLAHRKQDSTIADVPLVEVAVGDVVLVFPHEVCPIDGTVLEGHGVMDESYLTGEPYMMSKTPGSTVLSGAINGESALTIRADKLAVDSRYAKIMEVMLSSQQHQPRIRRLGDQLGAFYTPVAVAIGIAAWLATGDAVRFLAVMVVATPCPLLIAIPVAVIGSISLAAKRAIIVRDPAVLETVSTCRTIIFDKTGTLTYGQPELIEQNVVAGASAAEVLSLVASLEQYSKHPLAEAIVRAGREQGAMFREVSQISEPPGQGLRGTVAGREVRLTSRKQLAKEQPEVASELPPPAGGLECVILLDGRYVATYRFRDRPRREGRSFIRHLAPRHHIDRVMLLSGDRPAEVKYLADLVGIPEVLGGKSPGGKARDRACRDGAGQHDLRRRRDQRRSGARRRHGRHRLRPEQRRHDRSGRRRGDGQLAGQGRRIHAHQRADAADRARERGGRDGGEHRGHVVCGGRLPAAGGRSDRAGGDRRGGRGERFARGDSAAGIDRLLKAIGKQHHCVAAAGAGFEKSTLGAVSAPWVASK